MYTICQGVPHSIPRSAASITLAVLRSHRAALPRARTHRLMDTMSVFGMCFNYHAIGAR